MEVVLAIIRFLFSFLSPAVFVLEMKLEATGRASSASYIVVFLGYQHSRVVLLLFIIPLYENENKLTKIQTSVSTCSSGSLSTSGALEALPLHNRLLLDVKTTRWLIVCRHNQTFYNLLCLNSWLFYYSFLYYAAVEFPSLFNLLFNAQCLSWVVSRLITQDTPFKSCFVANSLSRRIN